MLGHLLQRHVRVLDHVVQDRRHQGRVIQMHFGQDSRHGQRVIDVRLAGLAVLPFVPLRTELVGVLHLVHLLLRQVGFQHLAQRLDPEFTGDPLIADGVVETTEHQGTI